MLAALNYRVSVSIESFEMPRSISSIIATYSSSHRKQRANRILELGQTPRSDFSDDERIPFCIIGVKRCYAGYVYDLDGIHNIPRRHDELAWNHCVEFPIV